MWTSNNIAVKVSIQFSWIANFCYSPLFETVMSRLDKLSIRGIRSYEPDEPQVIQFFTPLTVIVGKNGCGKTTIIESLMYATAGSLPALSKGGAFIYDPKIAGETSVKAQIRLRFNDVSGKQMTMTRNLQASQTKKGNSMKTLEALLQVENENGKHSITQKCADVNAEVQSRLGVSKAILENVIFCHQEESNWPLSEPSILKKKFDDIFSATEYAKMVKALIDISKKLSSDLKIQKTDLKYLVDNKSKSINKKIQLQQLSDRISSNNLQIASLQSQLDAKSIEMDNLVESTKEFNQLDALLSEYKSNKQHIQSNANDLFAQINPMPTESNEELQVILDVRNEHLQSNQSNLQQLQSNLKQLQASLNALVLNKDSHISHIAKLNSKIDLLNDKQSKLPAIPLHQLQQNQSELNSALQSIESQFAMNKQQLQLLMTHLQSQFTTTHDSLLDSTHKLQNTNQQISRLKLRLSNLKSSDINYNDLINKNHSEMSTLDNKLADLNTKLSNLDNNAINTSQLKQQIVRANKKQQLLLESDQLTELRNTNLSKIESYYNENQSLSTIRDYQHISILLTNKLQLIKEQALSNTNTIESTNQQLFKCEAEQQQIQQQISKYNSDKQQLEGILSPLGTNISQYTSHMDTTRAHIESASSAVAMKRLYNNFKETAAHNKHCGLCDSKFENPAALLSRIDKQLAMCDLATNTLPKNQSILRELEGCRILYDTVTTTNYDQMMRKQQEIQNKINMAKGQLSQLKRTLNEHQSTKEQLEQQLIKNKEIQSIGATDYTKLDQLQRQLADYEDIHIEDIKQLELNMDKQLQEQNKQKQELRVEINEFNKSKHILEKQLMDYNYKINEEKQVQASKMEMTRELNKLDASTAQFESAISTLKTQSANEKLELQKEQIKMDEMTTTYEQDKNRLQIEINHLKSKISMQMQLENEIKQLVDLRLNTQIEQLTSKLHLFQTQMQEKQGEIDGIKRDIQNKDALELGSKQLNRNIQDVFKYRKWMEEIKEIDAKIKEKQMKLLEYDKHMFSTQQGELSTCVNTFTKQIASLSGQTKQLDDQRKELSKELVTYYKDASIKHHKVLVDTLTGEMAINDLQQYAAALDKAIMTYHSEKMKLVNRIIRELWIETYQGNDIDTVAINTEMESKGNKSYNYRVCMIKGDVQIDMRGRCSAGQKVLASIIIRLALAEVFGTQCGILALDEPTTNLDKGNIEALAMSLCKIIQSRRKQSNFQLIVITHDERFLSIVGKREFIDYYYKIGKSVDQASVITRHDIDN